MENPNFNKLNKQLTIFSDLLGVPFRALTPQEGFFAQVLDCSEGLYEGLTVGDYALVFGKSVPTNQAPKTPTIYVIATYQGLIAPAILDVHICKTETSFASQFYRLMTGPGCKEPIPLNRTE